MLRFTVPANINILVLKDIAMDEEEGIKAKAILLVEQKMNLMSILSDDNLKEVGKVGVRVHINPIEPRKKKRRKRS